MATTKQRSLNPFKGRRKRHCVVKVKGVVLMRNRPVVAKDAAPISASATNMEVFGISIDELSDKRESADPNSDNNNSFALIQSSCLVKLVQELLCPFCKSANVRISLLDEKMCGLSAKVAISCGTCTYIIQMKCFSMTELEE